MPTIQAIFFDIGDTLIFDAPPLRERLLTAAQAVGVILSEATLPAAFRAAEAFAVRRYLEGIPWDQPDTMRQTVNFLWKALAHPLLSDSQWAAFAASYAAIPITRYVHPDAPALLAELKRRGFLLGAISDWEDTLPSVLTDLGLMPYLDALSISAVVGVTKPDPRLFEDAQDQVGLPADECLHVGDWAELDVAGAKAAGMNTLLFDWAERCPDLGSPRVMTFAQLADFLRTLPLPS